MKNILFLKRNLALIILCAISGISELHAQVTPELKHPRTAEMSPEEQEHFKSIASQLRCPTCTGLSVLDSDAAFSLQIQDLVKEQIASGQNEEAIMEFFLQRYGPWILREPPKKGFDLIAWIFPLLVLLGGAAFVWIAYWRRSAKTPESSQQTTTRSTEELLMEFKERIEQGRA